MVPDNMDRWKMSSFLDFISRGYEQSVEDGYLPRPVDVLHNESLRQLVEFPGSTINRPLTFEQNGRQLHPDDEISLHEKVNTIFLGRRNTAFGPDRHQICVSECNRRAFASCRAKIVSAIDGLFDFEKNPIAVKNGQTIESFGDIAQDFCEKLDTTDQLRFLYRVAELIHTAPFENFSKILDDISVRSGYEMWGNVHRGFGGVCAEKTAMLKFICDILSIHSSPVIGSRSTIPKDFDKLLKAYIDSEGLEELPIWIQHHLLEIGIGSNRYLVDVTGGNIPFTFLDSMDTDHLIQGGFRARMVYRVDRLHLCRASNWIGDALLTLSQYHIPGLNFQYIFEQGLGLHISSKAYIGVYFDWGGQRSFRIQNHYASLARRVRLPFPRFVHHDNMHSVTDKGLMKLLQKTLLALREQYRNQSYTGDFTFVIQPLTPHFWAMPRVSTSVRQIVWKSHISKQKLEDSVFVKSGF
jgi:hypothetical protein